MSGNQLEVGLRVRSDTESAERGLGNVTGELQGVQQAAGAADVPLASAGASADKLGEAAGQAGRQTGEMAREIDGASTAGGGMAGVMDGLALKIAAVGAAAVGSLAIGRVIKESVGAASDLQTQMLKLEGVIKATGGSAGFTAKEIDTLARKLDEATLGSAAGFRDAAAQLMTFRSISKETFERTLILSQDLASVMGGDVTGAAMQLGKALEDPVNGLSALRRSGVSFTEQQQELIKKLHESGQAAKAQGLILDEVAKQVGGVAEQMGSGLAGALDLVGKRWTDIKETLGEQLLPALSTLATKIADAMKVAQDSGAIEALGATLGYVANHADKLATILAVGIGIKAVGALRAFAVANGIVTASSGASAVAARSQAVALSAVAVAGKSAGVAMARLMVATGGATAAILAKVRALGALRLAMMSTGVGALVVGVGYLAGKFLEAKEAAEAGEAAVAEMLKPTPVNGPAAAVQQIAEQTEAASGQVRGLLSEFSKLRGEGKNTAEALQGAFDQVDLRSVDGIAELMTSLDVVRKSAGATGQEIERELGERLARLTAVELRDFGIMAEMAMNRAGRDAKELAAINEAVLTASFAKLGLTAEKELGRITPAAAEGIAALDGIRERLGAMQVDGEARMTALGSAIAAALSRTDTVAAAEVLKTKIVEMGRSGELSGVQLERALKGVETRIKGLQAELDPVEQAFRRLGITSTAELKHAAEGAREAFVTIRESGKATAEQLAQGFKRYAEAAIAANNGVVSSELKAQAAMHGLSVESDAAGRAIVRSMSEAAAAVESLSEKTNEAADGIARIKREASGLDGVWDADGNLIDRGKGGSATVKRMDNGQEAILSRAERLGGLSLRKEIEREWQRWADSRGPGGMAGMDPKYAKLLQGTIKKLDEIQIEQEQTSGKFAANQPRIASEVPATSSTTYRVEIGIGGGRSRTINTADQTSANALVDVLRQLEEAAARS